MLTLNDGRAELWQWDTGRTLAVDADCSQVHFSSKVFGRSIDVDVVDGAAIIPDILLQTDKDLNVWAFVGTAENGYTKISKTFKINRRNKPADYVFTPTEQMTLQMIQSQIGDLADLTTEAKNTLVAAINEAMTKGGGEVDPEEVRRIVGEYLASNPPTIAETDPTVPAWAKEAQKPSYTASEVGADPSGTAAAQVTAHNTAEAAHNDIRLLISGLTDRINALADSDDTTLDQLSEVVAYIKSNRELIEAITTSKVSVSDIIDNLTTNVANKPLSAAQGVALKAMIDAITIPEKLPNPNALTFTGAVTGSYDGSAPLSVEIPYGGGGGSGEAVTGKLLCKLVGDGVSSEVSQTFDETTMPDGLYYMRATYGTKTDDANQNIYCKIGGAGIWGNGTRGLYLSGNNSSIKYYGSAFFAIGQGIVFFEHINISGDLILHLDSDFAEDRGSISRTVSIYSQTSHILTEDTSLSVYRVM